MASKQSRDRLAFHRLREVSPVAHALQHHPQLLGSVRFRAQALGLKGSGLKGSGLESKVNCGVLMFPLLACFSSSGRLSLEQACPLLARQEVH